MDPADADLAKLLVERSYVRGDFVLASVLRAIERCLEEGLEIAQVAVLVDREEGGMDAIRAALPGAPAWAVFRRSELEALRGG